MLRKVTFILHIATDLITSSHIYLLLFNFLEHYNLHFINTYSFYSNIPSLKQPLFLVRRQC